MKGFLTLIVAAVLLYLIAMSFGLVGAPSDEGYLIALGLIALIGAGLMFRARMGGGGE